METIWWNPFGSELAILRTRRSPDECIATIQSNIHRRRFWTMADISAPFVGGVGHNRFTLAKNTPHFRSAVRPIAYGTTLADGGAGASIIINLAMPLYTRTMLAALLAIFAFMLLLSTLGAIGILSLDPALSNPFLVLIDGLIPGAIFYAWYLFGAWLSRKESAFLIDTPRRHLDATVAFEK